MANRVRNKPAQKEEYKVEDGAEIISNIQSKYDGNKKTINIAIGIVLAVALGIIGYYSFYKKPREQKGMMALNGAEQYFAMDSLNLALNGDPANAGFLKVIKKFDGTSAANIAHYYAGIIYLKQGDVKNAIKHLEDFDGNGTSIEFIASGVLGDAYWDNGDLKNAQEAYKKASSSNNDVIAATYLARLGSVYEKDNKTKEAIDAYKNLRDNYPQTMEARDMDKKLAMLGVVD